MSKKVNNMSKKINKKNIKILSATLFMLTMFSLNTFAMENNEINFNEKENNKFDNLYEEKNADKDDTFYKEYDDTYTEIDTDYVYKKTETHKEPSQILKTEEKPIVKKEQKKIIKIESNDKKEKTSKNMASETEIKQNIHKYYFSIIVKSIAMLYKIEKFEDDIVKSIEHEIESKMKDAKQAIAKILNINYENLENIKNFKDIIKFMEELDINNLSQPKYIEEILEKLAKEISSIKDILNSLFLPCCRMTRGKYQYIYEQYNNLLVEIVNKINYNIENIIPENALSKKENKKYLESDEEKEYGPYITKFKGTKIYELKDNIKNLINIILTDKFNKLHNEKYNSLLNKYIKLYETVNINTLKDEIPKLKAIMDKILNICKEKFDVITNKVNTINEKFISDEIYSALEDTEKKLPKKIINNKEENKKENKIKNQNNNKDLFKFLEDNTNDGIINLDNINYYDDYIEKIINKTINSNDNDFNDSINETTKDNIFLQKEILENLFKKVEDLYSKFEYISLSIKKEMNEINKLFPQTKYKKTLSDVEKKINDIIETIDMKAKNKNIDNEIDIAIKKLKIRKAQNILSKAYKISEYYKKIKEKARNLFNKLYICKQNYMDFKYRNYDTENEAITKKYEIIKIMENIGNLFKKIDVISERFIEDDEYKLTKTTPFYEIIENDFIELDKKIISLKNEIDLLGHDEKDKEKLIPFNKDKLNNLENLISQNKNSIMQKINEYNSKINSEYEELGHILESSNTLQSFKSKSLENIDIKIKNILNNIKICDDLTQAKQNINNGKIFFYKFGYLILIKRIEELETIKKDLENCNNKDKLKKLELKFDYIQDSAYNSLMEWQKIQDNIQYMSREELKEFKYLSKVNNIPLEDGISEFVQKINSLCENCIEIISQKNKDFNK